MSDNSILEKYQYLRDMDALLDMQIPMLETDATTLEELGPYMPGIMGKLSEYHASLIPKSNNSILASMLKPKHRVSALAHLRMWRKHLDDLAKGMEEGRPLIGFFGGSTPEPFVAMGAVPVFYETIAAFLSVAFTEGVEDDLDKSEEEGFATHLCGMQRGPFTAFGTGKLPLPTAFAKISAPCNSSNMYYQYVMDKYDIPVVIEDSPYRKGAHAFDYFHEEYKAMLQQLEELCGSRMDEDVLRKHVEFGNEQVSYLYKLQRLRRHKPNPDPGFLRAMDLPSMYHCGINKENAEYLKVRYEEAKARMDRGESLVPEGKKEIRTVWTWGVISHHADIYDWLEEEFGVTYLGCGITYLPEKEVGLVDTTSVESMIRGLALRTYNLPMVRQVMGSSDVLVNDMLTIARECQADAAVFSGNQTCKHAWAAHKRISDTLMDELGIPSLTYETDMIDKRFTPDATTKALLSEFFSTFE